MASDGRTIQIIGYVAVLTALFLPLAAIAGVVLGVMTTTKRGRQAHGVVIVVLSIVFAGVGALLWAGRAIA